ncbi:MAG: hypothetical protein ACOYM3_32295, partial [Terrimicrobiaceae bacterium]
MSSQIPTDLKSALTAIHPAPFLSGKATMKIAGILFVAMIAHAASGAVTIKGNADPFVAPEPPIYYEPQDLSDPEVIKFRQRADKILADAGNPVGDIQQAKAICDW